MTEETNTPENVSAIEEYVNQGGSLDNLEVASRIASKRGNVVNYVYDTKDPEGKTESGNVVTINLASDKFIGTVAIHEALHTLGEDKTGKMYEAIKTTEWHKENADKITKQYEEAYKDRANKDSLIREEIVARYMEQAINNPRAFLKSLEGKSGIADEIIAYFKGYNKYTKNLSKADKKTLNAVYNEYLNALKEEKGEKNTDGEKYDIIKKIVPSKIVFEERAKEVNKLKSVYTLKSNEFSKEFDEGTALEAVINYFNSIGNNAYNEELGDIELKKRGVKDSYSHGIGPEKAAAYKAVPDIINKGVVVEYNEKWKGNNYDTAVIVAPITIGGEEYNAAVVVRRTEGNQRFYLHEIDIEKRNALTESPSGSQTVELSSDPLINNIFKKIRKVNSSTQNNTNVAETYDEKDASTYEYEQTAKYSLVEDKKTIDFLNNQKKIKVYRAMQVIDGKLYPPMAAKIKGEDGKTSLVEATQLGKWYQADEHPELIVNGKFTLNKGNGSSIVAAYNPYWHTSKSPLNDQFSSAYKRDNLVIVECEVPESELTSGYKAEGAKDAVGEMAWHSGPVSSKLKGDKTRKVILSRWVKVDRIVSDSEVASKIATLLDGENVSVPDNTITPSLRAELEKRGVEIARTGKVAYNDVRYSLNEKSGNKSSIETDEKGEYLKIDLSDEVQKELDSLKGENRAKFVEKFINSAFRNVPFEMDNGKTAYVTGTGAKKMAHSFFEPKQNAALALDKLLSAAKFFTADNDVEHKKFDSFDYFNARVKIGDEMYTCVVNVGTTKGGGLYQVYDINQFKNEKDSPTGVSPLLGSANSLRQVSRESFDNHYTQENEKVNTSEGKFSLPETEKRAQNAKKVYTKSESKDIIDEVLKNELQEKYGFEFKGGKGALITRLQESFNKTSEKNKLSTAMDIAEYIVDRTVLNEIDYDVNTNGVSAKKLRTAVTDLLTTEDYAGIVGNIANKLVEGYDLKGKKDALTLQRDINAALKAEIKELSTKVRYAEAEKNVSMQIQNLTQSAKEFAKRKYSSQAFSGEEAQAVNAAFSKVVVRNKVNSDNAVAAIAVAKNFYTPERINGTTERETFGLYNQGVREDIEYLSETLEKGKNLTFEQLKTLNNVMKAVTHVFRSIDTIIYDGKRRHTAEVASTAIAEQRALPKPGKTFKGMRFFITNSCDPLAVFRFYNGYDDNATLIKLYNDIRNGETTTVTTQLEIMRPFDDFNKEHKKYAKRLGTATVELEVGVKKKQGIMPCFGF